MTLRAPTLRAPTLRALPLRALPLLSAAVLSLATLLSGLALVSGGAQAQRAPYGAEKYATPGSSSGRNQAGKFDYYTMVLSWSPTHCSEVSVRSDDMQCNRRDGRRYAFVLHGLWPQYHNGYPEACFIRNRPFVPRPVIDDMLDIMPAPGLIIHEYKKHGTCSGLDARSYFALSKKLYRSIKMPEQFTNPMEPIRIAPDEIEHAFIKANPGLKPDMISVSCNGSRLREVRICFSKEGQPQACGNNERRSCQAASIVIPPVRSSKY